MWTFIFSILLNISRDRIAGPLLAWIEGTTSPESLRSEDCDGIHMMASDVVADRVGRLRGWTLVRVENLHDSVGHCDAEWFSSPRSRGQCNDFYRNPFLSDLAAGGIGVDLRVIETQRIQA